MADKVVSIVQTGDVYMRKEIKLLRKTGKWARRAAISLFADRYWRHPGVTPVWVGSLSGGAYADLRFLNDRSVVYSFGIATEISFDRAIIQETGCQVFGFDPDPRCSRWLNQPERWVPPGFHFSELALSAVSGTFPFHMTDIELMSGSLTREYQNGFTAKVNCMTLRDIMSDKGHDLVDYLKLDIQGAEYDVLEAWRTDYQTLPVKQLWLEFFPDGKKWTEKDSTAWVRRLAALGMEPGYRNYFRYPQNYLLINTRLAEWKA
jgi:FkbM family methyltransferase